MKNNLNYINSDKEYQYKCTGTEPMCGIAGFLDLSHVIGTTNYQMIIEQMISTLRHRGPDDDGSWIDTEQGIALGHRRLSIIDLSPEGCQPMISANKRLVIAFNGEIYNFYELRKELLNLGHHFRGHSDTEVLLAALSQWGIESALKQCIGMFAFALWDRETQTLTLARDRLGEKPLYYGWMENNFLFGSELKALKAHPKWNGVIDRDALALFLRYNYIPTPYSIYHGIYKLLPGTLLTMKLSQAVPGHYPEPVPYWSVQHVVEEGITTPFHGSEEEAIKHLDSLLRSVIVDQMVADVPLGAFLSGGVDSSTIVALMQTQSNQPVKTFTIGFHESAYNEASHAKAVANYLGTDHTELYVTPEEVLSVIPHLPLLYDEPFADSSQIPTFLVAQLTRQHVTVSLSGDGGDEIFGGYNRYRAAPNIWKKISHIPPEYRYILSRIITSIPFPMLDTTMGWITPLLSKYGRVTSVDERIFKVTEVLASQTPDEVYYNLVSHWKSPTSLVLDSYEPQTILTNKNQWCELTDLTQRMMYLDLVTFLPDDILVKVDRASMGVSLESRIPFLDHRVVEFAWSLPLSMKVRNDQGKWILRQVLYKYVPKELIERPKTGFGVPIDSWLRGPLREWAEDLLDEQRLQQEGFFDPKPICEKWLQHLAGTYNWQYYLWDVLMFQAWLEHSK